MNVCPGVSTVYVDSHSVVVVTWDSLPWVSHKTVGTNLYGYMCVYVYTRVVCRTTWTT